MSSSAALDAEYASIVYLYNVYNYCTMVSAVVIFYDFLLTLSQEVNLIWSTKPQGAALVFLCNRYVAFIWSIFNVLVVFSWSSLTSCEVIDIADEALLLTLYVSWAVFSSLRVYATSGRRWGWTILTGALALVPFAVDLTMYAGSTYNIISLPVLGDQCNMNFSMPFPTISKVSILSRACLIASDVIVLAVIMYNTRQMVVFGQTRSSTAALLRRDGLQYFVVLLALNVLDMILFFTNVFDNTTSSFIVPISSIVISRCLLNLRQVGNSASDSTNDELSSELYFAPALDAIERNSTNRPLEDVHGPDHRSYADAVELSLISQRSDRVHGGTGTGSGV